MWWWEKDSSMPNSIYCMEINITFLLLFFLLKNQMLFAVKFMIIDWRHIFWRLWHFWRRNQQKQSKSRHTKAAKAHTLLTPNRGASECISIHRLVVPFFYSPSWFVYFCFGYILLLLKISLSLSSLFALPIPKNKIWMLFESIVFYYHNFHIIASFVICIKSGARSRAKKCHQHGV